jgi:iron complex outermembrane recepter protein
MRCVLFAGASALAFAFSAPAAAQQTEAEPSAETGNIIIVTAQKREQNWLDVPIALSVQSAEELRAERSTNSYDIIRQVPGVSGSNPSDELTQVSIRGVSSEDYGIGSDPTVGVFFDGVYLGRSENTATNFIDLERAEVARGPQGALFGRATPGGAISLVPVRPGPDTSYAFNGEAGTQGLFRGSVIGNVPLADNTFLRGSVVYDRSGDYVDNLTLDERLGGEESITGRLALRHEFSVMTALDITGWFESFVGDPWLYRNFTETVEEPDDLADLGTRFDYIGEIYSDLSAALQEESRRNWGTIVRLSHEFESGLSLASITSALGYDADYLDDFDGSEQFLFNYGQYSKQSLLTQELRVVAGNADRFHWFAGALIYQEDVDSDVVQSYGDFDLCVFYEFDDAAGCAPAGNGVTDTFIFARGESEGFAVYGEGEFAITDRLAVTGGLRYTYDLKKLLINAPVPGGYLPADEVGYTTPTGGRDVPRRQRFTSWQPRFAINYRPTDDLSLYGLYSEGEKPGGFDTFDAYSPAFFPEEVQTFELGFKGTVLDRAVLFSVAAFDTDYSNLQVLVSDGPRDIVKNAATAASRGIEAEATYNRGGLELGLRGAVIDANFREFVDPINGFDYSGNELPYTPKWSLGATIAFEQDFSSNLTAFGRVNADVQGRQFLTPANDPFASNPSYERVDFRFGLRKDSGLEFYAFGQNVTGADYVAYADVTDYNENFGAYLAQFSRPAVFGIGISIEQ